MSSTVVKRGAGARRCSAVGLCGSRPYLLPRFEVPATGEGAEFYEVQVRWKYILSSAAAIAGGAEPVYRCEEAPSGMFQQRVDLLLPAERPGLKERHVSATGTCCFTLCEAESEAAAAALQRLGSLREGGNVVDITYLWCVEMRRKCGILLLKGDHLRHGLDMLLSDWGDCLARIDHMYTSLCRQIGEDLCYRNDEAVIAVKEAVATRLAPIMLAMKEKLGSVNGEARALKVRLFKALDSTRQYFNDHVAGTDFGDVPGDAVEISMKLLLSEMMVSLGWHVPSYGLTWFARKHLYGCEVELKPRGISVDLKDDSIIAAGSNEESEEEAMESAAKAAIMLLEKQFGICLVDVNYNKRSHVESYVLEGEAMLDCISSLISVIRAEWEGKVDDLSECYMYCRKVVKEHEVKASCGDELNVKRECAGTVGRVYQACMADLEHAWLRYHGFVNGFKPFQSDW